MSADNGIYIHKFKEGYKVCHAQAIENIYWNRGNKKYNYKVLRDYFKDSPIFKIEEEALVYGAKLYKEIMESDFPVLEYGINIV